MTTTYQKPGEATPGAATASDPLAELQAQLRQLDDELTQSEQDVKAKTGTKAVLQKLVDELGKGSDAVAKGAEAVKKEIAESKAAVTAADAALKARLHEDHRHKLDAAIQGVENTITQLTGEEQALRAQAWEADQKATQTREEATSADADLARKRDALSKLAGQITGAQTGASKLRTALGGALSDGKDDEAWLQKYLLQLTLADLEKWSKPQHWNDLLAAAKTAYQSVQTKNAAAADAAADANVLKRNLADKEKALKAKQQSRLDDLKTEVEKLD